MSLLQVDRISLRYHTPQSETLAIEEISFRQSDAEFISIVGPSGCGKSSLLSIIAGLFPPSEGTAQLKGTDIRNPLPEIGLMQQQDYLLPWLRVIDNATFGLMLRDKKNPDSIAAVDAMLDDFGLAKYRDAYPRELSGGMRQRVALIRTLALDPELFLLDEAFSALDYQTRLELQDEVWRALRRRGKAMLMVTHDIPEAVAMSDRVIIFSPSPATVRRDISIRFDGLDGMARAPLSARKHPSFGSYFNTIWGELHDET